MYVLIFIFIASASASRRPPLNVLGSATLRDLQDLLNTTGKIYVYSLTHAPNYYVGGEACLYYVPEKVNETFFLLHMNYSEPSRSTPYTVYAELFPGGERHNPFMRERLGLGNTSYHDLLLVTYKPSVGCALFVLYIDDTRYCEVHVREDNLYSYYETPGSICTDYQEEICGTNVYNLYKPRCQPNSHWRIL
uniref:Putative salivary lipocalin group ii n=1 Tax=Hyalomma excavatum TaxID=257692 RepID=A0A131XM63_9ACAR